MTKRVCVLVCVLACASVARAKSRDEILGCVRGAAGVQGSYPTMQLAALAHDCSAACPGLAALTGLSPADKAKAFVQGCCPPEAMTALASRDWGKVSSACGVPATNELFASLEWAAYGRINQWLQTQASSGDATTRMAAADVFATLRRGVVLVLPLPASWKGHFTLVESTNGDDVTSWSYVLLDGGKLYAGSQPGVRFDAKTYIAPKFPEREVTLAKLRGAIEVFAIVAQGGGDPENVRAWLAKNPDRAAEQACAPPLLIADAGAKAAQLVDVVRAIGECGVNLAVSFNGVTAAHLVLLKRHTASDDKGQRVKLRGTTADVVKTLDSLYSTKISTALID